MMEIIDRNAYLKVFITTDVRVFNYISYVQTFDYTGNLQTVMILY